MESHLEHKFLSVRRHTPLFIWPFTMHAWSLLKKMYAGGKPARGRTKILIDCALSRNMKDVLANYNKTGELT